MTENRTATTVDWDPATDAACAAILEAVAEAKDVDPIEIDTPLYDVIDPDAVDRLFEKTGRQPGVRGGQLSFRYEDCRITVYGEGAVTARPERETGSENRAETAPTIGAGVGRE